MFNYICVRVIKYDSFCQIYELNRIGDKNNTPQLIECKDKYLITLEKNNIHRCSRNTIYGLKEYSDIVVRKNYISGFENFPDYGTCCIYSPFSTKEQIDHLLDTVKDMSEQDIKHYIQTNILEYVTSYMMKMVKQYNINSDVTDEQIKNAYTSLIYDYVMLKKQNQKI